MRNINYFQRCTLVRRHLLLPFCRLSLVWVHLRPSSVVNRLLVNRPSTVVFSPSSDRSASPLYRHRLKRFARQPDRTSSSSVVSQAVHRAVVCWSEEDNSIPFYTGFELSLKFPFDHFYNYRPSFSFWSFVSLEIINKFSP